MPRANDFSPDIKTRLAERAGYKCCYLGCGQATAGPSKENNNSEKSNTGVAAHVYSASGGPGARRIPPPEMTHEEIISLDNGIWMCQTHGKYIDNDEETFSVDELKKWKEIGEEVARKMQAFRCSYLDALKEIEHGDSKISNMITYAQKNDPNNDRYNTIDLFLYRQILKMIPESVRLAARHGRFTNRHSSSLRDAMGRYLFDIYSNPVELSFHNKKLQKQKLAMDQALEKLVDELNTSTFIDKERQDDEVYYFIPPEWQMSQEGIERYSLAEDRINRLSMEFIDSFDAFHKLCRGRFLE
ncbi:hypothetical protein KKF69_01360 [Patescibacteria group bacterium]|nr:hypothetical protein [Patescibacteria group bacterium]MBU4016105.1 hypothetical protein [Patescibacteria group bacterium]